MTFKLLNGLHGVTLLFGGCKISQRIVFISVRKARGSYYSQTWMMIGTSLPQEGDQTNPLGVVSVYRKIRSSVQSMERPNEGGLCILWEMRDTVLLS